MTGIRTDLACPRSQPDGPDADFHEARTIQMATEKRLGRGLGSLLGGSPEPAEGAASSEVPIDQIQPNPDQPRVHFDPASLEELRDSIRRHGVLQPLVLRRVDGGYHLIAGERRLRAARLAGLQFVPAVIRDDVSDEQMLELALVENVQRADLDAIEKANGYRRMVETLGLTQEQVARMVGLERSTVANHLRLLELPEKAQEAVSQGLITMGHARALIGAGSPKQVLGMVERIVREGLSVRQVEATVKARAERGGSKMVVPAAAEPVRPPWLVEMENRIRAHLGAKVRILNRPGYRGQIVLEYFGQEDLERLSDRLAPRSQV